MLHCAQDLRLVTNGPSSKPMTEGPGVVSYGCNEHSMRTATVRNPDTKKTKKKVKAGKQIQDQVQYSAVSELTIQKATQIPAKEDNKKKTDEQYKEALTFPETDGVMLFKNKNYKVPVSIGINLSRMLPTVCLFEIGAGPNLIRAYVLDPSWLETITQCDMPKI